MSSAHRSAGNLARLTEMTVHIDKTGTRAQVILPGFSYDDFDRTKPPNAFQLCRLAERNRSKLWRREDWADRFICTCRPNSTAYAKTTFIKAYRCLGDFYNRVRQGILNSVQTPLIIKHSIPYAGRTSYIWRQVVSDLEHAEDLIVCDNVYVLVDLKSGRPEPIPGHIKERLQPGLHVSERPRSVAIPDIPERLFSHSMPVLYSDRDILGHVNNSNYARFCIDTLHRACHHGFYRHIENIGDYLTDTFFMDFISECNYGDTIVCKTWQDDTDMSTLYFHLYRESDGELIVKAALKLDLLVKD